MYHFGVVFLTAKPMRNPLGVGVRRRVGYGVEKEGLVATKITTNRPISPSSCRLHTTPSLMASQLASSSHLAGSYDERSNNIIYHVSNKFPNIYIYNVSMSQFVNGSGPA